MYIHSCSKGVSKQSDQAESEMSTKTLKSKQSNARSRNHKLNMNNKTLQRQEVSKI